MRTAFEICMMRTARGELHYKNFMRKVHYENCTELYDGSSPDEDFY
jgi:hypothetical protein